MAMTPTPFPCIRTGLAAMVLLLALPAGAQPVPPAPAARLDDAAIVADHRGYQALQRRIRALNEAGVAVADPHLAKAQCWLDVSFHEYTRNDRGPFAQQALAQGDMLVKALEARTQPAGDTPLVAGAERLRPDLWQRARALQRHPGGRCAGALAACAEVELVHAGHEQAQLGWRHAKPYVQMAEDRLAQAEAAAAQCTVVAPAARPVAPMPAPAVAAVVPAPRPAPPPVAAAPAQSAQPVVLLTTVVFAFDRHGQADLQPASLASLQALLDRVRADRLTLQSVRLTGHADALNDTGLPDYNQRLSEQRADTVRQLLVARGVAPAIISTAAQGDARPVRTCAEPRQPVSRLRECLLPNRRVEVQFTATAP